ncbi:pyruvate kinase-like protein [Diaporthe sp. PMI_573]|nr:pyruvate kinase-like protein [Diaporthaceae sp. PMI_573]
MGLGVLGGENLTLDVPEDVDERNIMLGDRWIFSNPSAQTKDQHIISEDEAHHRGSAVVLEVCGGRSPCSRLAWRCGQPASWLAEVAKTGFCGVYLKVIQGGSIAAGDTATVIPTRSKETVPVATIAQCLFAPLTDPTTRTMAQAILRAEGLQNMNKKVVARRLAMIEDSEAAVRNRWRGWRGLKVTRVVDDCASVKSFYLAAADDKPLADYIRGQYLTFKLPSGQIRCWSISSWSPSTTTSVPPSYRITVKRGPSASHYLHSEAKSFPHRQIYICARISLTPILSMLQAHFAHPTLSKTPAVLIYVTQNSETDVPLMRSEIPISPHLRTMKFYTAPKPDVDVKGRDFDHEGRPTLDILASVVRQSYHIDPLGVTPVELPGNASNAYICGPETFIEGMKAYLEQCNVAPEAIRYEDFTYGSSEGDDPASIDGLDLPKAATVRFRGKESTWNMADGLSLLEFMEQEEGGDNLESACRAGDCGTCEILLFFSSK